MEARFRAIDILVAVSLLTRLPLPIDHGRAGARAARASWAYPLVGGLIGALGGGVYLGAMSIGAPALASAGLALAAQLMATGAIHEDGLADCADGLSGGSDRAHVLDIMRDSRIGAYGAAALCLSLLMRAALISAMPGLTGFVALVVSGLMSRAAMPAVMWMTPPARTDGLSASIGRPGWVESAAAGIQAVIAVLILAWLGPGFGVDARAGTLALGAVILAAICVRFRAVRTLGGQTGDVLGAVQQCGEVAALLAIACVAA